MTGFFASIPEAEIKTIFEGLRKRLEAASGMTAEQKTRMREMIDEQYQQINSLRAQRKAVRRYRNAVRAAVAEAGFRMTWSKSL